MANDQYPPNCDSQIEIWDTHYLSPNDALTVFRAQLCDALLQWSTKLQSDDTFQARFEVLKVENGVIARIRTAPLVSTRTQADIATSSVDCIYVNYLLAGEASVHQGGHSCVATAGDLLIFDGSLPTVYRHGESSYQDALCFLVPKSNLATFAGGDTLCQNLLVPQGRIFKPLVHCLQFIAANLAASSKSELGAVFDACIALLPLAASYAETPAEEFSSIKYRQSIAGENFDLCKWQSN